MDRYAVAVTMTKNEKMGINICTFLNDYSASSLDEAVGKGLREALEDNPGHQVSSTLALKLEPTHDHRR